MRSDILPVQSDRNDESSDTDSSEGDGHFYVHQPTEHRRSPPLPSSISHEPSNPVEGSTLPEAVSSPITQGHMNRPVGVVKPLLYAEIDPLQVQQFFENRLLPPAQEETPIALPEVSSSDITVPLIVSTPKSDPGTADIPPSLKGPPSGSKERPPSRPAEGPPPKDEPQPNQNKAGEWLKTGAVVTGVGAGAAVAVPVAGTAALTLAGFTSAGIAAGSAAAGVQAGIAGGVVAGSTFATLQSIAATGGLAILGPVGLAAGLVGVTGSAIGIFLYRRIKKNRNEAKEPLNSRPGNAIPRPPDKANL